MGKMAKYQQVVEWIHQQIDSGQLHAGDKLETEAQLSERFSFSRQTIRQALGELEKDGTITRIQGSGSYVRNAAPRRESAQGSGSVTIISSYTDSYIFPRILQPMVEVLQSEGYATRIMFTNNHRETEKNILTGMLNSITLGKIQNSDGIRKIAIWQVPEISGENIRLNYRTDYSLGSWDVTLNGNVNYNNQKSELVPTNNRSTYDFSYGGSYNLNMDNGFGFSTNLSMNSRRGYASAEMNTNELIWNAQVSYRFLKGKAANVSLQAYDILGQRSNISRTINATMRRDSETNAIYSYVMAHFIYRFNMFGGRNANRGGGNDRGSYMRSYDANGGRGGYEEGGGNRDGGGNRGGGGGNRGGGGFSD